MGEDLRNLRRAVRRWDWNFIETYAANGGDINVSLESIGPEAGYTILHFAVSLRDHVSVYNYLKNFADNPEEERTEEWEKFYVSLSNRFGNIKELTTKYHANVNSTGKDGATPLHIASFNRRENRNIDHTVHLIIDILLESGADVEVIVTKQLFDKFIVTDETCEECCDMKWSDDFGGTMTLLTFAILSGDEDLAYSLVQNNANFEIKDSNNKTWLMHLFENNPRVAYYIVIDSKPEFLNARDNNGYHALHYLLPYVNFEHFKYDKRIAIDDMLSSELSGLIYSGINVNAMVNNDPDTLLINMAAKRCFFYVLKTLLNLKYSCLCAEAEPLRYVLEPVDPSKYVGSSFIETEEYLFYIWSSGGEFDETKTLEERKKECLELIIQMYTLRRIFGLSVPEKDSKLMDQMISTDDKIKNIVCEFKEKIIENFLKKNKIYYYDDDDEKSITLYDFLFVVLNEKKLRLWVKNENFFEAWQETHYRIRYSLSRDAVRLLDLIYYAMRRAKARVLIVEKLEKIPTLREFIPLPYEIVLTIIEFLNNYHFWNFVNAFYSEEVISSKEITVGL